MNIQLISTSMSFHINYSTGRKSNVLSYQLLYGQKVNS